MEIVVIERAFPWTPFIALAAAVLGAVIGAAAVFASESWRQVLAFRTAARVICYETSHNATQCVLAVRPPQLSGELVDDAWKTHRYQLAALLPEEVYTDIALTYAMISRMRDVLQKLAQRSAETKDESSEDHTPREVIHDRLRQNVEKWAHSMSTHAEVLSRIQRESRVAQLFQALLGGPAIRPPAARQRPRQGTSGAPHKPSRNTGETGDSSAS